MVNLISDSTSLHHPTQPTSNKCNICNRRRGTLDENNQICDLCYKARTVFISSGNKVIDDFIKITLTNHNIIHGKMEFVPYDRFEGIEFIAEGGFSKIYKATWIDGPISKWDKEKKKYSRDGKKAVALKELNNSKNINPKNLNELKIFHDFIIFKNDYTSLDYYQYINKYYGITQNSNTQNFMIIMKYYESGDLTHYITKEFFNIKWYDKLNKLYDIIVGLNYIHNANIIHQDYHSGNIFLAVGKTPVTGDLGLSKPALESLDDDDKEIYGIIPYVAPEIFQGQKYTKASDIYSFGMIMWELMTGRRPFWDQNHDTTLIIKICDGLRPSIVTNAPEGYVELMQECWHPDPSKRPIAYKLAAKIRKMINNEWNYKYFNPTEIIKSPNIGPITMNDNPNAIYKSRPLSAMIKLAESARLERKNTLEFKRKFDDNLTEDNNNDEDKSMKKIKLCKNQNNDYLTKELEFDIDNDNASKSENNNYVTKEMYFDI